MSDYEIQVQADEMRSSDMMRSANLGRINGKLVAVDFGKLSSW